MEQRVMRYVFAVCAFGFFLLMFLLPVAITPGNDVPFQAKIFTWQNYLTLAGISILAGLSVTLQIRVWREKRAAQIQSAGTTALSGAGVLSGLVSSIFASATCATCVGALFGFLGFGGVLFLLTYRWYFLSGAIILLVFSIYFSARRINRGCEICIVPKT